MADFDYEYYRDDEDGEFLHYDDGMANLWQKELPEDTGVTLRELFTLCVNPTLSDGFFHSFHLLLWCFLFRITTQVFLLPSFLVHCISVTTGLFALHHFFSAMTYYIVFFAIFMYLVFFFTFYLLPRHKAAIVTIICFIILTICELLIVTRIDWHKIRGPQMVVAMKVISLAFDVEIGSIQKLPSAVEFAGYIFSPGTCVFGPWVAYKDYIILHQRQIWNWQWGWKIIKSLLFSLLFLSLSTCWIHWFISDDSWDWWIAYRDAFSFRSSHYFISFLSEASAVTAGYGNEEWSFHVSKPQFIEMPRSLVQIVIYWNIPMHYFLKTYIFRSARPLGGFASIIATYAVSSLLHGLNFQLAAVLLSLGFYTYIEYIFRKKLASIYNSCILVKSCKSECNQHIHRESEYSVLLANVVFGLIAVFHITYLGVLFDSSETAEHGYTYRHTLLKWSSLSFASHWFALATYLVYLLI